MRIFWIGKLHALRSTARVSTAGITASAPMRRMSSTPGSRLSNGRLRQNGAPDYESGGQEFESLRARQFDQKLRMTLPMIRGPFAYLGYTTRYTTALCLSERSRLERPHAACRVNLYAPTLHGVVLNFFPRGICHRRKRLGVYASVADREGCPIAVYRRLNHEDAAHRP